MSDFVTLYKYVSTKHLLETLKSELIYLDDGSSFNDPFELVLLNKDTGQKEFVNGLHILCLSNSFRNKLIWSHYTDSHKGVCLTLRLPKNLVYPVCYSSKRVFIDDDIDELIEKCHTKAKRNINTTYDLLSTRKKIAYLKDRKWSYEKEYRIVFDQKEETDLIHKDGKWYMTVKITNVYLGVNFFKNDAELKRTVLGICRQKNIRMTQMALSNRDYSLRVEERN